MGQDERLKENQKVVIRHIKKLQNGKKTICKSQEENLEKH